MPTTVDPARLPSKKRTRPYRGRSFVEIRRTKSPVAPDLLDLLTLIESDPGELPRHPGAEADLVDIVRVGFLGGRGIAQDLTHLGLEAPPMARRATAQALLDLVIELADYDLRHTPSESDITISSLVGTATAMRQRANTSVRPRPKSCSATRQAIAAAILSPPCVEGSIGLAKSASAAQIRRRSRIGRPLAKAARMMTSLNSARPVTARRWKRGSGYRGS